MSAQQKIAALEGLLAKIEANRALPRVAFVASVAGEEPKVAAAVAASPAHTPSTFEAAPEEVEVEDVELFDDEIVEVTVESDPPVAAPQASEAPDFELNFSDPSGNISAQPPSELEADLAAAPAEAFGAHAISAPAEAPVSSEILSASGGHPEEADFSEVSASLEVAAASDTQAAIPSAPASDPRSAEAEEEAPASSKRAKVTPTSMSEALAEAASQAEREVPLKTPPPESGPQAATPVQIPAAGRLPSLAPESSEAAPEPSAPTAPSRDVEAEPVNAAAAFAALEPEVAARKATEAAHVLRIVGAATAFTPKSFLELLDATLELCRGE